MKWFLNLNIGRKLIIGFGFLMDALVLVSGLSIVRLGKMNAASARIVDDPLAGAIAVISLVKDTNAIRLGEETLATDNGDDLDREAEKTIEECTEDIRVKIKEYDKSITAPDDRANFDVFKKHWEAYMTDQPKQLAYGRVDNHVEGMKLFQQRRASFQAAEKQLAIIGEWNKVQGDKLAKEAERSYAEARNIIIIVALIAQIAAAFLAWIITINMTKSVDAISGRLHQLKDNCITDLGKAIEAMSKGDLTTKIHPKTQPLELGTMDEFGHIADIFNEMLDLTKGTLVSYSSMQDNLSGLLQQVSVASESIAVGAGEVAAGNDDLSERTEEQAASLEETAASMEQMTSTVRQNADNAKQANQLAMQAKESAEKGGQVMRDVVANMQQIDAASNKIADIISVIDEIAFQTNLLALNAAVEAARVGEQGRGFAVVAAEVRNLASRSASAAKEIKGLVQDSVSRVQTGGELVTQSGAQLNDIVTSVKKVADIIAEISAAAQEQSAGIEQVNKAIIQMDQITQQNAALVEEATTASQSMAVQATGMREVVSQFKLETTQLTVVKAMTTATNLQEVESQKATGTHGKPRSKKSKAKPTLKIADSAEEADWFEGF